MKRLNNLNNQFQFAKAQTTSPLRNNKDLFKDSWSYLGMDEFLSEEGKKMRDNVRSFMERINPEVSSLENINDQITLDVLLC